MGVGVRNGAMAWGNNGGNDGGGCITGGGSYGAGCIMVGECGEVGGEITHRLDSSEGASKQASKQGSSQSVYRARTDA